GGPILSLFSFRSRCRWNSLALQRQRRSIPDRSVGTVAGKRISPQPGVCPFVVGIEVGGTNENRRRGFRFLLLGESRRGDRETGEAKPDHCAAEQEAPDIHHFRLNWESHVNPCIHYNYCSLPGFAGACQNGKDFLASR